MAKELQGIKQEYLTIKEAAIYMRLGETTVRTLIRLGLLIEYRPSEDSPRLKLSEVEAYVKKSVRRA